MKKKPLAEYDRSVKQSETFGKSVGLFQIRAPKSKN